MSFLIDTNVISELRKRNRCDRNVAYWYSQIADDDVFLSVLTVGEIRRGIDNIRRRESASAAALDAWLAALVALHSSRVLPIIEPIAEDWGRMSSPDPLPVVDGLLAATAKFHGLTLVTRNVDDVTTTGVPVLNPFESVS